MTTLLLMFEETGGTRFVDITEAGDAKIGAPAEHRVSSTSRGRGVRPHLGSEEEIRGVEFARRTARSRRATNQSRQPPRPSQMGWASRERRRATVDDLARL
ncbi:MAG: hypothetical protein U0232_12480 [Thermomicrobiales bacterium]